MKSLGALCLSLLLAVVSAQQLWKETLVGVCESLPRLQRVFYASQCVNSLRFELDSTDASIIKTCIEQSGLGDAFKDFSGGGESFENLPEDQEVREDNIEQCFLQAKGLADESGAINGELFVLWIKKVIEATDDLSGHLRSVHLASASSCPPPRHIKEIEAYKTCMEKTCITCFQHA